MLAHRPVAPPEHLVADAHRLAVGVDRALADLVDDARDVAADASGELRVGGREEAKDTTAGGIVLPETAKEKPQKGKVLSVGDGRVTKDGKRRELQVKVGDVVLFTSYAGEEFKLEGDKKVLLMREDDILAVIG